METYRPRDVHGKQPQQDSKTPWRQRRLALIPHMTLISLLVFVAATMATAQVNVLTAHNDIARTGQNLQETTLTPANVNSTQFGKLFTQATNGWIYTQPLYVSNVTIPNKGVHNVAYVGTSSEYMYAFDANDNGGIESTPLWSANLLAPGYQPNFPITGTPVIDRTSNTIYLVTSESQGSTSRFRLHALDITTGAEKFGGPVLIQGSVTGSGSGSVGGVLAFDPEVQYQRPGLLELNGVVYVAFGSYNDNGAWHGWIFSYTASTLQNISIFCTTPNGAGGGIWMGGSGVAAEVYNPAKPYGRMFFATGNGTYSTAAPYTNTMSYAMSVLDLDLSGGTPTVEDEFTPYNEPALNSGDGDLGSGGPLLLPTQTLASGKTLNALVQVGKSGMIYILDRDNNTDGSNNPATEYSPAGLGGFNTTADDVVQELQTPQSGANEWGWGVWGTEAYWNNNLYSGGYHFTYTELNEGGDPMAAYSFANGQLSTAPTSQTTELFAYPGATPSISANGTTNAIVWALKTDAYATSGPDILLAYDATNLANLLYSSSTNLARDNPGPAVQFTVPTIANGRVLVGSAAGLSVFGLLGTTPAALAPVLTPSGLFAGSETVTITDATPGAQVYYTTDGSTPTAGSQLYSGTITVTSTETITAIASATGYLQSPPAAATYTSTTSAMNPVFSLSAGSYNGAQSLTITDGSSGAVIYYTFDGTTPTTSSPVYSGPISIPVSETIQAIATAPGLVPSSVVSAAYSISPNYAIYFPEGFTNAASTGQMQFNGSTDLDDFRLQLTNGVKDEAGSAFFTTPVNIQAFTTDFTFQLSNPGGDGMTFTIQNTGPGALGAVASDLGYAGVGSKSIAIKFDFYNSSGQGNDSTGLYIGGVAPTLPSIDLTNTGINLRSGDYMNVHLTYDGTVLNMTITDAITLATWSTSFTINIPKKVGATTAYVGFTAGTGSNTSSQKVTSWTFVPGQPAAPSYPAGFDATGLTLNGTAVLNAAGTGLELTNGENNEAATAYYSTPVNVDAFTTDFIFTIGPGSNSSLGDGFTFVIQNAGLRALGGNGGQLGFTPIQESVAIKFDVYNGDGQGNDSTGVYVNGALPTVPAIDLTSSGVILGSGDHIHAHVTYNGTSLSWTLTDTTLASQPSVTNSTTLNIPDTVGGNVAYIGFTAGSGGSTAIQTILDWTYSSP